MKHGGNINRFLFCLAGILLIVLFYGGISYVKPDGCEVYFSAESGFYDTGFYLELDADAGDIYYTLDCSDPDENSIHYDGAIWIDDASNHKNVYSVIEGVSVDYRRDLLEQVSPVTTYDYATPAFSVDKANIVKAVAINKGIKGKVETRTYFVGYSEKVAYENVNIISVTTDPENLFDYDKGIYVMGRCFDDTLVDGKIVTPITPNIGWWNANYTQKGRDWERPAQISIWDKDRKLLLDGHYGIRIQGGSSRAFANKSLNIFYREEMDSPLIDGNILFHESISPGSLNLFNGGHARLTKLNDFLVNTLAADLNVAVRKFELYELFLEGEYWGVYWLMPRYESEYFQDKYRVAEDDLVMIKTGEVEIGEGNDVRLYEDMKDFIVSNDMSNTVNYRKFCEMVDIDSLVDYYAIEGYIVNRDWPDNNFALWRTRQGGAGKYADCRWRWIIYDVNLSMDSYNAERDLFEWISSVDPVFCSLLQNREFEHKMRERLLYLAENNFNPEKINELIDEYELVATAPMETEYSRFYGDRYTKEDFLSACEDIRTFFKKRHNYIVGEVRENSTNDIQISP